jgi:hypothetical protein
MTASNFASSVAVFTGVAGAAPVVATVDAVVVDAAAGFAVVGFAVVGVAVDAGVAGTVDDVEVATTKDDVAGNVVGRAAGAHEATTSPSTNVVTVRANEFGEVEMGTRKG